MPFKEESFEGASGRVCFNQTNRQLITVAKHVGRNGVEGVEGYLDGICWMRFHTEAYLFHTNGHDHEGLAIRREQPVARAQDGAYGVSDTRHCDGFPFDRRDSVVIPIQFEDGRETEHHTILALPSTRE